MILFKYFKLLALSLIISLALSGCSEKTQKSSAANFDEQPPRVFLSAPQKTSAVAGFGYAVDIERTKRDLSTLTNDIGSRLIGTSGNGEAADYIYKCLEEAGYVADNLSRMPFLALDKKTENIIARIPTSSKDSKIFVLSAHYDSMSCDAAIDNASGVTALLELSRHLISASANSAYEVRFCFFSGEEFGYIGACNYLASLDAAERDRICAVVNIDMAGGTKGRASNTLTVTTLGGDDKNGEYHDFSLYNPRSNFVSDVFDESFSSLSLNVSNYASPIFNMKTDLQAFHYYKIPGVTVSWREYDPPRATASGGQATPLEMHEKTDTYDNFDMDGLESTILLVESAVSKLLEK
ncbi:MAG: M28 family peptidase [Oscillospiraceae bacterium]